MLKDSGNDTKHVLNSKILWEWLLMSSRLSFSTSFPGPAAIQSQHEGTVKTSMEVSLMFLFLTLTRSLPTEI